MQGVEARRRASAPASTAAEVRPCVHLGHLDSLLPAARPRIHCPTTATPRARPRVRPSVPPHAGLPCSTYPPRSMGRVPGPSLSRADSPTRMISHSNSIPELWKTLFRTSSPNPSRSAARGAAGIGEEIRMLHVHHRAAAGRAAHAGVVDQLPGLQLVAVVGPPGRGKPGRIAEGRAGGAVPHRLAGVAAGQLLVHPRRQRPPASPAGPSSSTSVTTQSVGQRAVAIAKAQVPGPQPHHLACPASPRWRRGTHRRHSCRSSRRSS